MSKSSKKRRQAAKKRMELDKLRGLALGGAREVSLLDEGSPAQPSQFSPTPGSTIVSNDPPVENGGSAGKRRRDHSQEDAANDQGPAPFLSSGVGSESLSTKRKLIQFVLPRAHGKAQQYVFDKERAKSKADLSTIVEEDTQSEAASESRAKKNESLDEILFPKKRLRLADKFEAVHQADEKEKEEKSAKSQMSSEAPPAPLKPKKKKRRRSSSLDKAEEEKKESDGKKVHTRKTDQARDSNGGVTFDDEAPSSMNMANRQWSGRSVEEAVQDKHGLRPRANSTDGELNLPQRGLCDEQMVLRSHQWLDQHKHAHQATPRGFVNLGNTCFLNSILQCLAYLPPLCQSLIAISDMKKKQPTNGTETKPSQGQRITSSLCTLFQKVHGFPGSSTRDGSIAPQGIVKALPTLGSIGSRNGYKFWPGRQEDAHEFLVHLLDAMHDGELRAAGINQRVSGWRDRLPVTRLDETTFIHRVFGGYFRSQVRCKACGYCSNTYDPFLDLSLEVSKKSSNSIIQSLAEFTKRETLDSNNQWKCSGCKKYVCPTKQLTVFRPPLSLCIQMKRFSFDGGFSSFGGGGGWKNGKKKGGYGGGYGGRSKITKPIEFPADLNLPLSDSRSCAYTLTGVVIHVGGSASSGHYTAYVKKPSRNGQAQWYHADDSFVEPVSEKTVLKQKDAYVLFYSRKEVKLEFPSPPPRTMSTEEAREFGRARARARADSNTMQDDSKLEASQESSMKDGALQRTKASIHPLAEFLNSTMAEQFKTTMSPESTKAEKRIQRVESKSQDATAVRKSPSEALLDQANNPASKAPDGQSATRNGGESSSDPDSSEEVEVEVSTESNAAGDGASSKSARSPAPRSNHDSSSESESKAEGETSGEADKPKNKSISSSSSSESGSSESETETKPMSERSSLSTSNTTTPKTAADDSSDSESEAEGASEREKKPVEEASPKVSSTEKPGGKQTPVEGSSSESHSGESDSEIEGTVEAKKHPPIQKASPSAEKPGAKQSPLEGSSSESESSERETEGVVESGIQKPIPKPSPNVKSAGKSAAKQSTVEGSSSESDSSDSESEAEGKAESMKTSVQSTPTHAVPSGTPKAEGGGSGNRTRVVVGSADSRGKVKVMMGPRTRKAWVAKTSATTQKGAAFQLLGNMGVSRWDDDDDDKTTGSQPSQVSKSTTPLEMERDQIVKKMEKQDKSRKRKMHLDRWDSFMDQGRVKKMKTKSESTNPTFSDKPNKNVFQRIQSSLQSMNKGKAKGLFRRKDASGDKRKAGRR